MRTNRPRGAPSSTIATRSSPANTPDAILGTSRRNGTNSSPRRIQSSRGSVLPEAITT